MMTCGSFLFLGHMGGLDFAKNCLPYLLLEQLFLARFTPAVRIGAPVAREAKHKLRCHSQSWCFGTSCIASRLGWARIVRSCTILHLYEALAFDVL